MHLKGYELTIHKQDGHMSDHYVLGLVNAINMGCGYWKEAYQVLQIVNLKGRKKRKEKR
jgi:phage major head subunit gpT-like protein